MKPVAILSTTILPTDGRYDVRTLESMPDVSGVKHYCGHPDTARLLESFGAEKASSNLFLGLQVGESAIAFAIAQGKSTRAAQGFTTPHQNVTMEDMSIRLIARLQDQCGCGQKE